MKIQNNPVNTQSFHGKFIDAHTHIGKWTNDAFSPKDIVAFLDRKYNNGADYIDRVIISNLSCIKPSENCAPLENELIGNLELLKACVKNKRLVPFIVCQPGYGSAENIKALLTIFPKLIKGLKFHPTCLNVPANDASYIPYMKLAQKHKIPCLFHSQVDMNGGNVLRTGVSDPEFIYETARQFPDVPVILGHMGLGGGKANDIAIETMVTSINRNDAKLYADLAWVDCDTAQKPHIVKAIKELLNTSQGDKTDRILFGTDAPLGIFGEKAMIKENSYEENINNIKAAIQEHFGNDADRLINNIFYENCNKLL